MIIWLTGQPNSGKTTIGMRLQRKFIAWQYQTIHLDGDVWRNMTLNHDYSDEGRRRNLDMAMAVAWTLNSEDMIVICSFVSPYRDMRERLKTSGADVLEVYLHTTRSHDVKDAFRPDYQHPLTNFLDIDTDHQIDECVVRILDVAADRLQRAALLSRKLEERKGLSI
jgi:adenylylsulfate kinase